MTVCTNHLALRNLADHVVPSAVPQATGNREILVAEVVKFYDERITLTAVDARVRNEVIEQKRPPLRKKGLSAT
jgi:hypothetical protein